MKRVAFILIVFLLGSTAAYSTQGTVPEELEINAEKYSLQNTNREYDLGEHGDFIYDRPTSYGFLLNAATDQKTYLDLTFRKENTLDIAGVAAATAVLMLFDQEILNETQRFGDRIGVKSRQDKTKTFFTVLDFNIRFPTDIGSSMYFIGDGWTHLSAGGIVLSYGLLTDDLRAMQTGSQVFEAVLAAGFATQVLKHLTGRESPFKATAKNGKWRLFPNQFEYHKNIPAYDAFPSGHLATGMATVTVIAGNYPEMTLIKPIGYTLLTLLSFQMMNNGVHWASDYPLALAMGYSFGKIAISHGRKEKSVDKSAAGRIDFPYIIAVGNSPGIGFRYTF